MFLMFGLAVILAGKTRVCVFRRPPRFPASLTRQERFRSAIYASSRHPPPWLASGFQNPPAGSSRQGRGGRPRRAAAPESRANSARAQWWRRIKSAPDRGRPPLSRSPRTPLPSSLCAVCEGARLIRQVVAPSASPRPSSGPRRRATGSGAPTEGVPARDTIATNERYLWTLRRRSATHQRNCFGASNRASRTERGACRKLPGSVGPPIGMRLSWQPKTLVDGGAGAVAGVRINDRRTKDTDNPARAWRASTYLQFARRTFRLTNRKGPTNRDPHAPNSARRDRP